MKWIAAMLLTALAVSGADPKALEDQNLRQLLKVNRVYVDHLGGGETATELRDMIIASLQRSDLFVVTENQDHADTILRGSGEDLIFTDTFQSSDSLDARAGFGVGTSSGSRSYANRRSGSGQVGVGENESSRIAERKHEAVAAVRLVNKDGDVIWSTTQESLGAKFRGASADVADKITRQLTEDFDRARNLMPSR